MLKRGIFERFFIHFFILLALSIFVRAQSSSATLTTFKASALIGENLNVSWYVSGVTNANDYIALVPTGKPFSSGYPFVLTKGARTGNKSLTVPANVQSVQFMYYSAAAKKEIGRSAAIAVSSSTVTLQPSKNIVLIGEALQVTWVVSGITNTYDYIALVPTGKPFSSGYPFVLTKGARTGNKSLTVPANVQSVQFMYYSAAAKKEIGRSAAIAVSSSTVTLQPSKNIVLIGEALQVTWYVSGITNTYDYIALVPTGKPFSSGYPFVLTKGARTGNKSLTVPANVQSVQFMYYSAAAKKEIGRSAAIAVSSSTVTLQPSKNIVLIGEALQVTWVVSGITNTYDYIALVPTGKPFSSGYPFVLTKGARTGNKSLTVPANVQSVQFMYYSAAAKKEIGRSAAIAVSS